MLIEKKLTHSRVKTLATKAIHTGQRSYAVFKVRGRCVDYFDTFFMYTPNHHKCQVFDRLQYLCHFPVGWVERSETQLKLNVFVGFRSLTQPTNQDIFDFGEGIEITNHFYQNFLTSE